MARYAKLAGVLFLLSMIGGGLGEAYVPGKLIVSSDAAMTAANLKSSDFLFRFGFAAYLIEAICDIALAWGLLRAAASRASRARVARCIFRTRLDGCFRFRGTVLSRVIAGVARRGVSEVVLENFDFVAKDGALASARRRHDVVLNSIGNIRARQSKEKPNEITVDVVDGQSISGKITIEPSS
jgi:hypothetical protein